MIKIINSLIKNNKVIQTITQLIISKTTKRETDIYQFQ